MNAILNISAYLFVPLPDAAALRLPLQHKAQDLGLKGTILLAHEGINLFLAGPPAAVRAYLDELRQDPRLQALTPKESWSAQQPFRKMHVRLKREIIRMNHPTIQPAEGRAPAISADTARRWLDQGHDDTGRPVAVLDTRNAFEVDQGTFVNSIDWRLDKFSDFPQALQAHRAELADKTIISCCTGGIRCEKAVLYMREQGLPHSYQLDGGILKYFEDVGSAHYQGDCFVFDEREALNPQLQARRV